MLSTQTAESKVMMKGLAVKRVIRFGEFELSDPPSRLLENDSEVHLRPQVMRALLLLAENPGEIVSREELREAIWKDLKHVEVERGIKTVIRELRKALGDNPSEPKYIETVRGVGYRFVARGQLEEEPLLRAPTKPGRRSVRIWIAAAAVVAAIALLAFGWSLLSPDQATLLVPRLRTSDSVPELATLCERLNEELAKELIGDHSREISLVHVFAPPEELSMSPRVARYAVDGHLSEGPVPGGFYIALELIDRADETIVWMSTFELSAEDVESWPEQGADEIARAVLEAAS